MNEATRLSLFIVCVDLMQVSVSMNISACVCVRIVIPPLCV